jgi:Concanavalin A-like lectin/glucanases superfamily
LIYLSQESSLAFRCFGKWRAALAINGRTYGEAKAFAPQGITSRKIIGRHAWMQNYFHGDLAEMLIYNKALSPHELAETTAYLAKKYAIQLEPRDTLPPGTRQ